MKTKMKTITFLTSLLISATSFAQIAFTSFEEPNIVTVQYTDLGDPAVAHDLVSNENESIVNFTSTGGEMGFNARYEPYDVPSTGLTDGDWVGVVDVTEFEVGAISTTDGSQGYKISDVDGNYILEFDPVDLTGFTDVTLSFNLLIKSSMYEGNGTENHSESDTFRIYVKDLANGAEYDVFSPLGMNITSLYLNFWQGGEVSLPSDITTAQLIVHVRTSEPEEAIYFDDFVFDGKATLSLDDINIKQNQFSVYPNPSKDFVNITSQISGNKNIEIYNLLGKRIINTTISSDRLNVSELISGIYMMKITQNGSSSTKKLIIK
ncbi:MAG: T9SS type A sorting domain-containing protein [Flavobacteriaceae bacterium]|nr:T9SS type A sorting domain-containing protein [Flavobacteriaceae bacterium]